MGGLKYGAGQSYATQLDAMKLRVSKLAALNARCKANAMFHTHSGIGVVGASIWDLYILLKDFDPTSVGVNYDVGHATVEGGFGGWINSFNICGKYVRGIAVKDFLWARNARGQWMPAWKPLGEGMVHFPEFFQWLRRPTSPVPCSCTSNIPWPGPTPEKPSSPGVRTRCFLRCEKTSRSYAGTSIKRTLKRNSSASLEQGPGLGAGKLNRH